MTTSLTLLALALSPGNVITIPREVPVVAAGRFNWALQERPILIRPQTRAIVTRLAPEGLTGVVEVRVFDGTNRLGWLEDAGLAPIRAAVADPASTLPGSTRARSDARPQDFRTWRRKRDPMRFAEVDAAIASLMQAALRSQAASPGGMPVFSMPVFQMTVFAMPVF